MSNTHPGSMDEESNADNENNFQSYWDEKLEDLNKTDYLSSLSKNQQKKLLKKKLLMETRTERRKKERERKKLKRAERKEAGVPLPVSRQIRKRMKRECSNYSVVIDLDFYHLMNEQDHRKVLKQLKSCYSENRRSEQPLHLCITSFATDVKDLFLKLQPGILNWSLRMESKNYADVFEKEHIVYLTSDSENILDKLDEDKVYVIGGLVDHNHQKGLCYKLAQEKEFAHAQLPIGQYVKMSSRKVLTINHVFEILLAYSLSKDWKDAFFKVLPNRKGVSGLDKEKVDKSEDLKDDDDDEVCEQSMEYDTPSEPNLSEAVFEASYPSDAEDNENAET